jgi:hypothetical protein
MNLEDYVIAIFFDMGKVSFMAETVTEIEF